MFDFAWADAYQRAGGQYYPKLQIASPFSPVPGPRLLLREPAYAQTLISAIEAAVAQWKLSSAHATFVDPVQIPLFESAGWLIRTGEQFHWTNDSYADFEAFLAALSSRTRKAIRKERSVAQTGITIEQLTGTAITETHWEIFWNFYQDTGARKWGQPYLTREFFSMLGASMGDKLLLILAKDGDRTIAGALNLIGADTLYGRYWGCSEDRPCLHFELCYYQAIDAAISRGLSRVEAGAQGHHKLARGYLPVKTWSAHFIAHPGLKRAIADFLEREREAIAADIAAITEMTPFKRG